MFGTYDGVIADERAVSPSLMLVQQLLQEATLDEASQALERSRICGTRVLDTRALILEQPSLQQQKPSVSAPTLAVGA